MSGPVGRVALAVALALVAGHAGRASADRDASNATHTDDLGNARPDTGAATVHVSDEVVIRSTPDRTPKNIALCAGLGGGGALIAGLGVLFHLGSRDAADQVSAADFTHKPWTPALQATYDRAHTDATRAEIAYGLGGALLVAAAVTLIVTAPAEETTILHPRVGAAPLPGGATVMAGWRF